MKITYTSMKVEQTECSVTLAYKLQMLANHPKESNTTCRIWRKFEIKNLVAHFGVMIRTAWEWMKQKMWQKQYEGFPSGTLLWKN
jgi:hypothetical protein